MLSRNRAGSSALALSLATALLVIFTIGTAAPAGAQVRWDRGQNVAPVFEGWERNADGTFNMVFGYMNRNYEEMPHIPVGENNFFEPGRRTAASRPASTCGASSSSSRCRCRPTGARRTWSGR